jgi:hypothetical protein
LVGPLSSLAAAAVAAVGLATGPFETGILDPGAFGGAEAPAAFAATRAAGASLVRIPADWRSIAPDGPVRPAGFDAGSPADPRYRWNDLDRQVRAAVANGLQPVVGLQGAPGWAERGLVGDPGTRDPGAAEFRLFARAAARRYAGGFRGLPRVRYWQAWNEPNLDWFLMPQVDANGEPVSPALYRSLLNAFADGVRSVHRDNLVLAGGLTPFGERGRAIAPLRFMRELLCISNDPIPRRTCKARVKMDVWAHNPYSNGNARWKPFDPDAGSMGNLPDMRRLLLAAQRLGRIDSPHPLRFWVTEFSWDTSPPDPGAVPAALHARWVAEAFFRMWQQGVSAVMWFTLRDEPFPASVFQSGLYYGGAGFAAERAKPALEVFRFPFAAFPEGDLLRVWGRTPASRRSTVLIEQGSGSTWTRLALVSTNRWGVFTTRIARSGTAPVRARLAPSAEASVPFALETPPGDDLTMATPFGTGLGAWVR